SAWEGGLRVPCIVEYPDGIHPRVTDYPASTMDIFPTIAAMLEMPPSEMLAPVDGISLAPLFRVPIGRREQPIPFRYKRQRALVDNQYKLVTQNIEEEPFALYDLDRDQAETNNIAEQYPEVFERLKARCLEWNASVDASVAGRDYPPGTVLEEIKPRSWRQDEQYQALFPEWEKDPAYRKIMSYVKRDEASD
ncbi:MAG: sulfatase, partial [Kiritimatiellia bacterium]